MMCVCFCFAGMCRCDVCVLHVWLLFVVFFAEMCLMLFLGFCFVEMCHCDVFVLFCVCRYVLS